MNTNTAGPFTLRTWKLGALPLLQHVLDKLDVDALLGECVVPRTRRAHLPPAVTLGVLLRNILLGRRALYGLAEWAGDYDPELLGLSARTVALLNDDRAGRALDQLFDADRASLMTAVVLRAITRFGVELEQFHNDSTSITFTGQYAQASGRKLRGKQALRITEGHNKDHRPDLKQLLWILTISEDGAVPIHYRVCDGNTTDDRTHVETWEMLCKLCNRVDFLYIADCKLCTRDQMGHIAGKGGRFITVLPRTRKEDAWFRRHIQDHDVTWREAIREPNSRRAGAADNTWSVNDLALCSAEGYHMVWVHSSLKAESDRDTRLKALEKTYDRIEVLNGKLKGKRARLKERGRVLEAAQTILKEIGTGRWVDVDVAEHSDVTYRQKGAGRPGPNTPYEKKVRTRFEVLYKPNAEAITYDAKSDGMFPLITNCKAEALSPEEVLKKYRYQPKLEKRHEQLKTDYAVAPAFLKNEGRIEALLLLYFLALLVQALIERQVRLGMDAEGSDSLPLYPENRDCRAPTANRIFEVFQTVQRHELVRDSTFVQRFHPELTPLQHHLLRLIGAPREIYPGTD